MLRVLVTVFCVVHGSNLVPNSGQWIPMARGTASENPVAASDLNALILNQLAKNQLNDVRPSVVGSSLVNSSLFLLNGGWDPGSQYVSFQDIWMLYQSSPTEIEWHILAHDNETRPWPTHSDGHVFIQMASGDILRYGGGYCLDPGCGDFVYSGEVWVLSTKTLRWTQIHPSGPQPPARAWFWMRSIGGQGNSESFLEFGGEGSDDNIAYSKFDVDKRDSWILTLTNNGGNYTGSWQNLVSECTEIAEACSDAQALVDQFTALSGIMTDLNVVINARIRPNNWTQYIRHSLDDIDSMAALLNSSTNADSLGPTNQDSTCTPYCSDYNYPENYPTKRSVARFVVDNNQIFLWGGYSCTANGNIALGGDECFDNAVYIYDLNAKNWTKLSKPGDGSPQDLLWPLGRNYHVMALYQHKFYTGFGFYIDSAGVFTFYNDIHVFNLITLQWEPIRIIGNKPSLRSGAAAFVDGSDLWLVMGRQGTNWPGDVWRLSLGLNLDSTNMFASGEALMNATAGALQTVFIQARDRTINGRVIQPGSSITTALGFSDFFQVSIVETPFGPTSSSIQSAIDSPLAINALGSTVLLDSGLVTEVGQGEYSATFTPRYGSTFSLFIKFQGVDIVGSPFTVNLFSQTQTSSKLSYLPSAPLTEANSWYTFTVIVCDQFGNPVSFDVAHLSLLVNSQPTEFKSAFGGAGLYTIGFLPPVYVGTYQLSVQVNGTDVIGSPFNVQNLESLGVSQNVRHGMMIFAGIGILIVLGLMISVFVFREDSVMKAATPLFMEMILVGSVLGLCSVFTIAYQSDTACRAFPMVLGLAFIMLMGALYVKTWRLMVIFRQRDMKIYAIKLSRMVSMLAALVVIEFVFNIVWISIDPPKLAIVQGSPAPRVYFECDGNHFQIWEGISYSYKAAFLLYGIFLAVMTRGLPENFKESSWIALSIYNTAFCGGVVLLVVYTAKTQDTLAAVFTIICIFIIWVSVGTAALLVVPKLYRIYTGTSDESAVKKTMPSDVAAPNISTTTAMSL